MSKVELISLTPNAEKTMAYIARVSNPKNQENEFYLSKEIFEQILIQNNLLNHLNSLLKDLLNQARGKFCTVEDLNAIVLVGGGTQIPLIKEWLTKIRRWPPKPIKDLMNFIDLK